MTDQPTLTLLRGYPASGKSTVARLYVAQTPEGSRTRMRLNRDDLRASLLDRHGRLPWPLEQQITKVQHASARALLHAGADVMVDDTNLWLKYARAWADLAVAAGARFDVLDVPTDLDECLRRDRLRESTGERHVGADVIRGFAERFPLGRWPKIKPTPVGLTGAPLPVYTPTGSLPPAAPGAF